MSDSDSGEEYDAFNTSDAISDGNGGGETSSSSFLFDSASIAHVTATAEASASQTSQPNRRRRFTSVGSSRSAATTQLATDVGSTIISSRVPFLKSVTFFDPKIYYRSDQEVAAAAAGDENGDNDNDNDDDITVEINDMQHWEIQLQDPPSTTNQQQHDSAPTKKTIRQKLHQSKLGTALKLNKSQSHLIIQNFEGLFDYSSIQSGDSLLSINKHTIDPTITNATEARRFMDQCIQNEGVLNIITENPHGDDIILHITVIKPRRDMDYTELGLVVWNWPYLCVHQVKEGSIFEHTPIREMDQITAINDIDCSKMREGGFAQCVAELPVELTISLVRRKHRYSGSFK